MAQPIIGEGETGYPDAAPYDRVHVGCGTADVLYCWIEQCTPGGSIVLPWRPRPSLGHLLRLTVLGSAHAVGSFHGPANQPMLQRQRRGLAWAPGLRHRDRYTSGPSLHHLGRPGRTLGHRRA